MNARQRRTFTRAMQRKNPGVVEDFTDACLLRAAIRDRRLRRLRTKRIGANFKRAAGSATKAFKAFGEAAQNLLPSLKKLEEAS